MKIPIIDKLDPAANHAFISKEAVNQCVFCISSISGVEIEVKDLSGIVAIGASSGKVVITS